MKKKNYIMPMGLYIHIALVLYFPMAGFIKAEISTIFLYDLPLSVNYFVAAGW